MGSSRAWSFLAIEGDRQYGGNTGYDDSPKLHYLYDEDVGNHLQVNAGDLVAIRSKNGVIGLSVIDDIIEGIGQKNRLRCPTCNETNIKKRVTLSPAWRCKNGHLFDEPVPELVTVKTYQARYGKSFRAIDSLIGIEDLEKAVMRPTDQMSIKEIDLAILEPALRQDANCWALVRGYAARISVLDGDVADPNSVAADSESIIEQRRKVLREILVRRGQKQFRDRLIKRYGSACQISGCAFPGLVEAAHLLPYSTSSDNSAGNGILLRSDLHTLFDLGLLGIEPKTLRVKFQPAVVRAGYAEFSDRSLMLNGSAEPNADAIRDRWEFFSNKSKQKIES
jgi:hypothetical protein